MVISGRYALDKLVGMDDETAIWKARDSVRDVPVALKRPRSANGWTVLRREAGILAGLDDPHIVGLHTALREVPCLVVDYVDGSVAERLRRGPVASDDVRQIGLAMCAALTCAHRAGVLHLGVTPWSILGTTAEGWKLSGFGSSPIAKSCWFGPCGARFVCQTAPEQLRGEAASPSTDLYQLAVTLYQALEGRCPWKGARAASPEGPINYPKFTTGDTRVRRMIAAALERHFSDAPAFASALQNDP